MPQVTTVSYTADTEDFLVPMITSVNREAGHHPFQKRGQEDGILFHYCKCLPTTSRPSELLEELLVGIQLSSFHEFFADSLFTA